MQRLNVKAVEAAAAVGSALAFDALLFARGLGLAARKKPVTARALGLIQVGC